MTQENSDAKRARLLLALATVYLVWGSTYLAIRVAVQSLPPFLTMGTRSLIGGLLLLALVPRGELGTIRVVHWRSAAIGGAFLFLGGHGLLAWSETRTSSSTAALVVATMPLWLVALIWLRERRRPSILTCAGIGVGFGGVVLLLLPAGGLLEGTSQTAPLIALLACSISWACGSCYVRRAPLPSSVRAATAMQLLCGGLLLLGAGLIAGETAPSASLRIAVGPVLALAYLVVFGTVVTLTAYMWLLRSVAPALANSHAFVNPVVALILGTVLAGEALEPSTLAAGLLIVSSVAMLVASNRLPSSASLQRARASPSNRIGWVPRETSACKEGSS